MKYKSIFKLCLLTTFLSVATISCDDWTEMEIHDSQVNGFKEQNPQEYAAYTQNLRAYKATKHAVVYARLDNAPEVSIGEKDFLRALPDSIDIVTMRNADRLSEYDREDMKLVREDYGTKVLYYIDCTAKDKQNTSITSAVEAVRTGTFDGIALGSEGSAVDVSVLKPLVDAASDEYDIETSVLYATGYGKAAPDRLLLAVTPDGTLTDNNGVTRNAIAGAAYGALNMETPLGGIAIYNISADYYDTDIIYKQTRGGIQFLNPASVH